MIRGARGDIIMLSPWGEPDDCSAVARIRGKHQLLSAGFLVGCSADPAGVRYGLYS